MQNDLNNNNSNEANITDYFQKYFGKRINITFELSTGLKIVMLPPENINFQNCY